MILKSADICREETGDLPYFLRLGDIDGCHHVEESLNSVGACKLDQAYAVPKLELMRRHGLFPNREAS
jgi:hypothetical protein